MNRPPYRVGVIGLGAQGLDQIKQLLRNPGKWRINGTVDRSKASYARFRNLYGEQYNIPCFGRVKDLIDWGEYDVILVSTTAPAHVAITRELIDAGYRNAILIEKPISNNLAAARDLVESIDETHWPGKIAVDFNRRCSQLYSQLRPLILNGELGTVRRITYKRKCKISMKGSHYIDLAGWYIQARPVRVTATLGQASTVDTRGAFFFDPEGRIEVLFENGAEFIFDAYGTDESLPEGLDMNCEHGEALIDTDELSLTIKRSGETKQSASDKTNPGGIYYWVENTISALVDESTPFVACPIEDALLSLEIMAAAHHSSVNGGQPMPLPLTHEQATLTLRIA